jgi:nicotinic acid mononucleotide adenylyltransferase
MMEFDPASYGHLAVFLAVVAIISIHKELVTDSASGNSGEKRR